MRTLETDVAIIGAGPSGALAAALLQQAGVSCMVVEKELFPRFVIGESLLPQCMDVIAKAGLLPACQAAGLQIKHGALFRRGDEKGHVSFADLIRPDYPFTWTWQVLREHFDEVLIRAVERRGIPVLWRHEVTGVDFSRSAQLQLRTAQGEDLQLRANFILDASGYGRVLPRLLGLEQPSCMSSRRAVFTHWQGPRSETLQELEHITICVDPQQRQNWTWVIPLSPERLSVGFVCADDPQQRDWSAEELYRHYLAKDDWLLRRISATTQMAEVREIKGYSAAVSSLHGPGWALLGNAGEFLDPVFSSGVTLAMRSAELATDQILAERRGAKADWSAYAAELMQGVDVFRAFVNTWYDGSLQDIIFAPRKTEDVRRMINSILAGYVWDRDNPYCSHSQRRLAALAHICREQT